MKVERIKSSRRRRLTETWSPGRRWRAGASTPSPARDGPAAAWTERNSCRRGWVRETACGSSARSAAESTADTAPRSTRSRSAGSGSAAACGRGTARRRRQHHHHQSNPALPNLWPWSTKPGIRVTFMILRLINELFVDVWFGRYLIIWNLRVQKTSEYWENQVINVYY